MPLHLLRLGPRFCSMSTCTAQFPLLELEYGTFDRACVNIHSFGKQDLCYFFQEFDKLDLGVGSKIKHFDRTLGLRRRPQGRAESETSSVFSEREH